MILTLEISPGVEAQIERAAAQSQTDVREFILEAAAEESGAQQHAKQGGAAQLDGLDELWSLGARLTAGAEPLADGALARSKGSP